MSFSIDLMTHVIRHIGSRIIILRAFLPVINEDWKRSNFSARKLQRCTEPLHLRLHGCKEKRC